MTSEGYLFICLTFDAIKSAFFLLTQGDLRAFKWPGGWSADSLFQTIWKRAHRNYFESACPFKNPTFTKKHFSHRPQKKYKKAYEMVDSVFIKNISIIYYLFLLFYF